MSAVKNNRKESTLFTSKKVEMFLQSCKFMGEEDKSNLDCSFYVTPLTYDLCYEVSDRIAKQLFRKAGSVYEPTQELGLTVLNIGETPAYNFELFPHGSEGSDGSGQMIPSCRIGKVSADKLFTDDPNWSLIFKAILPLSSHSLTLCHRYYKKKVFITFVEAEGTLFKTDDAKNLIFLDDATVESAKPLLCESCQKTAAYLDTNQASWCSDHVGAAVGTQVRKIKYSSGAA